MAASGIKDNCRDLRRKTKNIAGTHSGKTEKSSSQSDLDVLTHEIKAYRSELEMQNARLVQSRNALETSRSQYEELYYKYANLFDLAPNAYVVFDEGMTIREANLTAAILFNLPKGELIGQPIIQFIHQDEHDGFHHLMQESRISRNPLSAELKMVQTGGRNLAVQFQLQYLPQSNTSGNEYRAAILDLSEQMRISSTLQLLHQCLETAVSAEGVQQLLDAYVQQIKIYTKCSAVGIRLKEESGNIPYRACDGFTQHFNDSENPLCLHYDQCMCIDVIKGRTDPDNSFFTPFGSFYINGTSRFPASLPPEMLGRTRNACNAAGYESVALIPIYLDRDVSGLVHVADHRVNMFPLRVVEVLQQAAMRLGLALQRFYIQGKLREALRDQRNLSSHLLRAQEEEQRRIAMELHDQTGQDLNVLKLRLGQIKKKLRPDQDDLQQLCQNTQHFADHIIDDIRRMIRGLSPSALEALGLIAALRQIAREYNERSVLQVETHLEPLEMIKNRETQLVLFRIVQEALSNAFKHADASKVVIRAFEVTNGMNIVIEDNGNGFDSRHRTQPERGMKGMGLAAMDLRARMIGAQLAIQGTPGEGTRITISIPMGET